MDAATELGRDPVRKHQIQPEYGDEQAATGRDGNAEPVSRDQLLRRERGLRETLIFPVQLTTRKIGNLTRLIHILAICVAIHSTEHKGVSTCTTGVYTSSTLYEQIPALEIDHPEQA